MELLAQGPWCPLQGRNGYREKTKLETGLTLEVNLVFFCANNFGK